MASVALCPAPVSIQSDGMPTTTTRKTTRKPAAKQAAKQAARKAVKAVPGNPFAGVEHVFGSISFRPLKGEALKKHIRARILADHNT